MAIYNQIIKLFSTGLYFGYSPIIPGTCGTVPIWIIAYFLIGNQFGGMAMIVSAIVVTFISVYLSGKAEKLFGHDAGKIVIDEWAGMLITLIAVPYSLTNYVIAFIAFRFFDVIKIYPANAAEKLPSGWGVTADDVIAGIQACLITHLTIYLINNYIS
ncbi:MAG: phosphatidylglycerophosphatase A [Candidatus Zixiibacteriota bacterium]